MELFTITLHAPGTSEHGRPMHPMDPNPGHADQGVLAYWSLSAAVEAAIYQNRVCDLGASRKQWVATSLSSVDPQWLPTPETSPSL